MTNTAVEIRNLTKVFDGKEAVSYTHRCILYIQDFIRAMAVNSCEMQGKDFCGKGDSL